MKKQFTHPKTGVVWTLIEVRDYERKTDGKPSKILTWEALCSKEGCLKKIHRTSGVNPEVSNALGRIHCDDHKSTAPHWSGFSKKQPKDDVSDLV